MEQRPSSVGARFDPATRGASTRDAPPAMARRWGVRNGASRAADQGGRRGSAAVGHVRHRRRWGSRLPRRAAMRRIAQADLPDDERGEREEEKEDESAHPVPRLQRGLFARVGTAFPARAAGRLDQSVAVRTLRWRIELSASEPIDGRRDVRDAGNRRRVRIDRRMTRDLWHQHLSRSAPTAMPSCRRAGSASSRRQTYGVRGLPQERVCFF